VNIELIPAELRVRGQWVTWRFEQRDGKQTKPPWRVDGSAHASADDPASWGSFDQALATLEAGEVDGIGYVFSEEDPFVGVDLDKCRNGSGLTADAGAILLKLDSYAEWSPSGQGAHVILRGRLPGSRRRKGQVEMYDQRRFFAMTGEHIRGCPTTIEERQAELELIYGMVFPKPQINDIEEVARNLASDSSVLPKLDDLQLIETIRGSEQGAKFSALWQGDTSGYGSHSEADLALCSILAFWTQKDVIRIDGLFRRSGLMRAKWDSRRGESSYGTQTTAKAIEGLSEVYQPTSERPRPVLAPSSPPGSPETSSPLAPTPVGGEDVGILAPRPRPQGLWRRIDVVAAAAHPPAPPEVADLLYPAVYTSSRASSSPARPGCSLPRPRRSFSPVVASSGSTRTR
jgi:putative DNA primase/helicase